MEHSDSSSTGGQRGGLQRALGDKERESGSVLFHTGKTVDHGKPFVFL